MKAAADAFSATLQWIDQGYKLTKVDPITQAVRIATCENCHLRVLPTGEIDPDGGRFEPKERRCLECCCPMDFKTSLMFEPIKGLVRKKLIACPLGKW